MNIRSIKFGQLTTEEISAWSASQRSEPALASPFFRPEFSRCVASVRSDVEVMVLEEDSRAIGFLPYHRDRWNVAQPVGGHLSDYDGLIAPAKLNLDPQKLLRACGLSAYHFYHLPSDQSFVAPFVWSQSDSLYLELSGGFNAYIAARKNGGHVMKEFRAKMRRLSRNFGSVRFEPRV
jgi:CelD/BcsL family acetyltransferase involved in cellulose biosynthesis